MPTKFLGSDFQINVDTGFGDGLPGNQQFPEVTTMSDGRFAVVYQSEFEGLPSDIDSVGAIFNADGTATNKNFLQLYGIVANQNQSQPDAAGLPNGGFGFVFSNQLHANGHTDGTGTNITYDRVSSSGVVGTAPNTDVSVGDTSLDLINPKIASFSDNRQIVVFESAFSATDHDLFYNVVSADGTSTQYNPATPAGFATSTAWEANPDVATDGGLGAMIVYESSIGTTKASANIVARLYNGLINFMDTPITIADHAGELANPSVTALDNHRYVIIYSDISMGTVSVYGKIYDTSTATLSPEFQIDQPGNLDFYYPQVTATGDGGFIATWANDAPPFDIYARRYNSDGVAMGQQFVVNQKSEDGVQLYPSVAVSGANAFFAWSDYQSRSTDTSPSSVRGQVMSLTTPPDFNDNGVSDMLWRKSDGSLAMWDISKTGAIAGSSAVNSGGTPVAPDSSYSIVAESDFTGDGRADLVWRNTAGATSLWAMNGSSITSSSGFTSGGSVVNPDPSWSVIGAGDFNGDGMSDLLWRNTATTQVAIWTMNGSTITNSASPTSGGTPIYPPLNWNMAALGDFNSDGKSDLLWRNTSTGELAIWTMNGGVITNSAPATSGGANAQPNSDWSVAGVGDFNADGNADLLWRNGATGELSLWSMNGSVITSSGALTSGGSQAQPDANWHVIEVGDFNDDARTDLLWRNDATGQVSEWLMKGTTILSSIAPTSGGSPAYPDSSYTLQAKPTNFG